MSINLIKDEIKRFLSTSEPETICIKGKWGVGKTFTWNYLFEQNIESKAVVLKNYSYISLFGTKTLNELKYGLFEGTHDIYDARVGPNEKTLVKNFKLAKRNLRRIGGFLTKSPFIQSYIGSSESTLFFSVREQIVCIDDLDRLGGELTVKDILGMISFLKEQRKCKVVLLLNQEELKQEDIKLFDEQIEKVADIIFDFKPTPREAADIVFGNESSIHKSLSEHCIKLGIVNIRVLKKIERIADRLSELLIDIYPNLISQAMHSVALLTWAVYQPNEAPPISYIKTYNRYSLKSQNEKTLDPENSWWTLLFEYDFMSMNTFDLEILTGINAGYFDVDTLMLIAKEEAIKINNNINDTDFQEAWGLYHDSFEDNQTIFLDSLYSSAMKNVNNIHPSNINSTVAFLKEFGRHDQYTALIRKYVSTNPNALNSLDKYERNFWDITDVGLLEALKEQNANVKPGRDLRKILISIWENKIYEDNDVPFLNSVTEDEFYNLFIKATGHEKNHLIQAALYLGKEVQDNERIKDVYNKSLAALKRIASTNSLNAKRIAHYGINL